MIILNNLMILSYLPEDGKMVNCENLKSIFYMYNYLSNL